MWGLRIMLLQKSGKTNRTTIKGVLLLSAVPSFGVKSNGKLQTTLN